MSARRAGTLPPASLATADIGPTAAGERTPLSARLTILAFALIAVVALGWVLAKPEGSGADSTRPPATASGDDAKPQRVELTWQDFAGISLPASTVDGPTCTDAGRSRCFTHTDAGAALAAVHLLVKTFPFAGSAVFGPTIREQVTGPDAASFARLTLQAYDDVARAAGVADGGPIPSEGGWVAGYRLAAPTTTQASDERTVDVLIRQTDSDGQIGFTEYTVRLVWRHDDWALIAPAWGDWRNAARPMQDADRSRYLTYDGMA